MALAQDGAANGVKAGGKEYTKAQPFRERGREKKTFNKSLLQRPKLPKKNRKKAAASIDHQIT